MEVIIPPSEKPRQMVFTDEFRSFYDPRQDFLRSESRELRQWLCDGRSESPDSDERLHVGSRVIANELAHTRRIYLDRHDNAGGLDIAHNELDDIVDRAYFDASETIRGLQKGVTRLLHDHPIIAERAKTEDPELVLTLGGMGSALSHFMQKRRSGKDYAVHPWESVMISDVIDAMVFKNGLPPEYSLQSIVMKYALYSHDELEDDMSSKEGFRNKPFLATPKVHMTPLVHYLLLQQRGVNEEIADYTSDGMLRLTKTVGLSGRKDWRDYIRILASAAPVAPPGYEGVITEAKDIEMHYNSVVDMDKEPDPADFETSVLTEVLKNHWRRKGDYDWAREELHRYGRDLKGYPAAIAPIVPGITAADIEKQKSDKSFVSLLVPNMLVAAYFSANETA